MLGVVRCRVVGVAAWGRVSARACPGARQVHAERQGHRGLVRVAGPEAAEFLQGLVTNDVGHVCGEGGAAAMYCLLLNRQGRVLHDSLLYRQARDAFLLECDGQRAAQLERHLRLHRVRRRLDVDDVTGQLGVWCVFDPHPDMTQVTQVDAEALYINPGVEAGVPLTVHDGSGEVLAVQDPRVRLLGHRLVVPAATESLAALVPGVQEEHVEEHSFRALRYRLGVGEGPEELPPTKCLPLEANCDYLHGVSFHKGCYVGQELTARTFHTGVIRKRLMPLVFATDTSAVPPDAPVTNEQGKAVGRVRACLGHHGLGLLRVEECLAAKTLTADGQPLQTFRPAWWPIQAAKTKAGM